MSRVRVELLLLESEHTWDHEGWFLPLARALEGVTAVQAAWKPSGDCNSIWATLSHLNYYNERYLCRFTGEEPGPGPGVTTNTSTFEVSAIPDAEIAWQAEVKRADAIAAGLRTFLEGLTDEALEQTGDLGKNLPHLLLHTAYHTGQIMMLRKQQAAWPATRE